MNLAQKSFRFSEKQKDHLNRWSLSFTYLATRNAGEHFATLRPETNTLAVWILLSQVGGGLSISFPTARILSRLVLLNSMRLRRYSPPETIVPRNSPPDCYVCGPSIISPEVLTDLFGIQNSPVDCFAQATRPHKPTAWRRPNGWNPPQSFLHFVIFVFAKSEKQKDHLKDGLSTTYLATTYFPRTLRSKYHQPGGLN